MTYLQIATILLLGVVGMYGTVMTIGSCHFMGNGMENECDEHMVDHRESMCHGNTTDDNEEDMCFGESQESVNESGRGLESLYTNLIYNN